jgi:DNA polymerase-1
VPAGSSDKVKIAKGKAISQQFKRGLPALGSLMKYCESKVTKNGGPGYMLMPDGRRVYIRHAHAALNSLLQSAGAIICKRWIVDFNRRLTARFGPQGWDGQWAAMLWVHDEVQLAVRPEIADEVQEILVDSIRSITAHFNWRVPLDGEAKVGANWQETH